MIVKKICVFLGVLLLLGVTTTAFGSIIDGKKFEFSTAISWESYSYHYPGQPATYQDKWSYFNIPIRFGWYIWKGLEFEPEFLWTLYHEHYGNGSSVENYNTSNYLLSLNLLYNYRLNPTSHWVPFILVGYGFGNGAPEEGNISDWGTGYKVSTPNLGIGVKYLFGNIGALRLEYRYRYYRIKDVEDSTPYHYTFNTIFVGLSLFF